MSEFLEQIVKQKIDMINTGIWAIQMASRESMKTDILTLINKDRSPEMQKLAKEIERMS